MKKTTLGATLVAGLALLVAGCHGHHRYHGHRDWQQHAQRPNAERMTKFLTKKLDLSADQAAKAQALLQQVMDQRQSWRGEGSGMMDGLKAQFQSSKFDAKAMDQAFAQRQKKMAESHALWVKNLAAFHAMLTPEQRSKLADLLGKFGDHDRGRDREHDRSDARSKP